MEQFRQLGEVVGSINALMVFESNIFNPRQCCLLVEMLREGYKTISEQMKSNLRFEENTKWRIMEHPLKELVRVFKDGEMYIRQCLETKDWWAKVITLYQNTDCVELYIHNLLTCIPVVIEAIEMAGEISGVDQEELQNKKIVYNSKYLQRYNKDPRVFQWRYGEHYLVSENFCTRLDSVWEEDRWLLLKKIKDKQNSGCFTSKHDHRLADLLLKNLSRNEEDDQPRMSPSSTLVNSKDYQVRRRLGNGSQYKEIQWLGESFALRHFFGDIETTVPEISQGLTLYHPNVMHTLCGFTDEEKKECFLIMELMNRDLSSYIKEICGPRRRIPFSLQAAVDLMLQIARGMEYLHSRNIYHGELNPSNILVKVRNVSSDRYLHAKVSGFGLSSSICLTQSTPRTQQNGTSPFIWYAPEVLEEQESFSDASSVKYSEKSDVYSFGMICFEILTGKVPFDDTHLQGDKMSRNIRAGERPLFPFHSPKYITSLTKKCWHVDPAQRPSFSSICRIFRYIKRIVAMNPDQDPPVSLVDFYDIEVGLSRSYFAGNGSAVLSVWQIPFQMFMYKVTEKEKLSMGQRDYSESGSDASAYEDDSAVHTDCDAFTSPTERKPLPSPEKIARSLSFSPSPEKLARSLSLSKKSLEIKTSKQPGTPKGRAVRPPQITPRALRMKSESQLMTMSPRTRRKSGHVSDSELS